MMDRENNQTRNEAFAEQDDYLWDGSGKPDPQIQRLETILGRFRHNRPAPVFPDIAPGRRWTWFLLRVRLFPAMAISAAVVAIVAGAVFVYQRKSAPVAVAGWDVSRLAGTPRVGRKIVAKETSRLVIGEVLETDQQSRARLRAEDIGQIEIDPGTRLRVLNVGAGLERIALDRGTIHTYIWASPGRFVVDTPSAVTVDLGCAYTLQVDDSGAGLVRTSMGWVGFKLKSRESFIPAGAACATRPKIGPGTPYFEDAASEFRAALARLDFDDSTPQQRSDDLAIVLGVARKRDALTLWHLLSRISEDQRVLVFDRLQEFLPVPPGVTKEGILRLDQPMLDLWWNELGFDDISVWRHWERSWSGEVTPRGTK
jgi:FecR protein